MSSLIACTKHGENRYTARSERTNERRRRPQLNASQKTHATNILSFEPRPGEAAYIQQHRHTLNWATDASVECGKIMVKGIYHANSIRTSWTFFFLARAKPWRDETCAPFSNGAIACLSVCVLPRSVRVMVVLVLHLKIFIRMFHFIRAYSVLLLLVERND